MACSHPLTRIESTDGHITFTGAYIKDAEASKEWKKKLETQGNIKSIKTIPCGQCINCRLDKSRDWANRVMLEAKEFKNNYFITLTYDEINVPYKQIIDTETGEIIIGQTLKKEDLTNFNKRLNITWKRKHNHQGIRYYECGEYGETTERPHYHLIIFNLPHLEDLKYYTTTDTGNILYTSETITKIWGKGYVTIGEVTWDSACYVARYVMKKKYGKDAENYYKSKAKIPEFTTMSRMPGIAKNYYDQNKEKIYATDEIFIQGTKEIIKAKPSKYFDRLYEKENPKHMKEIKRKRDISLNRKNEILTKELIAPEKIQEQREIKERQTGERIKKLKRDTIC